MKKFNIVKNINILILNFRFKMETQELIMYFDPSYPECTFWIKNNKVVMLRSGNNNLKIEHYYFKKILDMDGLSLGFNHLFTLFRDEFRVYNIHIFRTTQCTDYPSNLHVIVDLINEKLKEKNVQKI
jgi:hypothetical protein